MKIEIRQKQKLDDMLFQKENTLNPTQDGLFGATHGCGEQSPHLHCPVHKICHTHPIMMQLGTVVPYLKKIQKIYESRDRPLEFS